MLVTFILFTLGLQSTETPKGPDTGRESNSARVEALRARIHGMRMDLILGGDKVKQAESDAAQFYKSRVELYDQRLDSVAGELTELKANYQSTLERTLSSSGDTRPAALHEAAEQRSRIQALQAEESELGERRDHVEKMIGAVEARGRERERLATKLEGYTEYGEAFAMQIGGIGLAPDVDAASTSSPLDDDGLIQDLLALDPASARRVIFENDPLDYWRRFPLRPPEPVLRKALKF